MSAWSILLLSASSLAGAKPVHFKPVDGALGCQGQVAHVSADGKEVSCVATLGGGKFGIARFSLSDGTLLGTHPIEKTGVSWYGAAFSDDGSLVGASSTGGAWVWSASDGATARSASGDGQWAFTKDRVFWATAKELSVWQRSDLENAEGPSTWGRGLDAPGAVAAMDDPATAFVARDNTVSAVEPGATGSKWDQETEGEVTSLAVSPDGKVLAVLHKEKLAFHEAETGKETSAIELEKLKGAHVTWSPDGKRLAVGCFGGLQIFDVGGTEPLLEASWVKGGEYPKAGFAWTPSGEVVAIIEDLKKGAHVAKFQP